MTAATPGGTPEQNTSEVNSDRPGNVGAMGNAGPAAGWYPTPSGEQRYWDGEQWLALPAPPDVAPSSPQSQETKSQPRNRRRLKWALIAGAAVLVLGLIAGGVAWKIADNERQAEAAAQAAAEQSAAEASEEQARQEAAAASAAASAQERADEAERTSRLASIPGIEASVKTMAEGHAADGIIDGPIIEVTCSPVGGGSTDDLTQQTTVFACFAAYRDNGDGTMSGYTYKATMNWSTGSYTYGLGAP
jgi:hypothetical protein